MSGAEALSPNKKTWELRMGSYPLPGYWLRMPIGSPQRWRAICPGSNNGTKRRAVSNRITRRVLFRGLGTRKEIGSGIRSPSIEQRKALSKSAKPLKISVSSGAATWLAMDGNGRAIYSFLGWWARERFL